MNSSHKFSLCLLIILLSLNISFCDEKIKIPITSIDGSSLQFVSFSEGEKDSTELMTIDLGTKETWLKKDYEDNSANEQSSIDYELFSLKGKKSNEKIYLMGEDNKKIGINDYSYTQVKELPENINLRNALALGKTDSPLFKLDYASFNSEIDTSKNNFGFSLNFDKSLLTVGNLYDEEKLISSHMIEEPLVDGEKDAKWAINLKGFFIGNLDITSKKVDYEETTRADGSKEKIYIVPKDTPGALVEKPMSLETVYNNMYVSKAVLDFLEKNKYFDLKDDKKKCKRVEKENSNEIFYLCDKEEVDRLEDINLIFDNDYVYTLDRKELVDCDEKVEDMCQFNLKYNSKFGFVLGFSVLKNLKTNFMINSQKILFDEEDRMFRVSLNETDYDYVDAKIKKKIRKAFGELFKTIIVILGLFLILFVFFYIHEKCCGDKYLNKKEDDKATELVEQK